MNCPECKTALKYLFTGTYCPNDCDRPDLKAKQLAAINKTIAEAQDLSAKPRIYTHLPVGGTLSWPLPSAAKAAYQPTDDQCRDPMCRSKGTMEYQTYIGFTLTDTTYKCNLCSKTWTITHSTAGGSNGMAQSPVSVYDPSLWD